MLGQPTKGRNDLSHSDRRDAISERNATLRHVDVYPIEFAESRLDWFKVAPSDCLFVIRNPDNAEIAGDPSKGSAARSEAICRRCAGSF